MTSERSLVPEGLSPAVSPAAVKPSGAVTLMGRLLRGEGRWSRRDRGPGGWIGWLVRPCRAQGCPVPRRRGSFGAFVDGELDLRDVRPGRRRGLRPLAVGQDSDEGFVAVGLAKAAASCSLSASRLSRSPSCGPRCRFPGVGGDGREDPAGHGHERRGEGDAGGAVGGVGAEDSVEVLFDLGHVPVGAAGAIRRGIAEDLGGGEVRLERLTRTGDTIGKHGVEPRRVRRARPE
jgi:hypothetical protein